MAAPPHQPSLTPDELTQELIAQRQELDSLRALQYLGKSQNARRWAFWLGGILYSGAIAVAGWYGREITSKLQIDALRGTVTEQGGTLVTLQSHEKDLRSDIAKRQAEIAFLREELRVVRRNYVIVTAAVYAGESAQKRKRMAKAADDFARAYDNQIKQGSPPAAAEQVVLTKIAIP